MTARFLWLFLASLVAFLLEFRIASIPSSYILGEDGDGAPASFVFTSHNKHNAMDDRNNDSNNIPPSPRTAPLELLVPSGNVAIFFNTYLAETTKENMGKERRRGLQIIDLMLGHLRDSKHLQGKVHLYYSHMSKEQIEPNELKDIMCQYMPNDDKHNKCTEVYRSKEGDEKDTLQKLWEYCQRVPPEELVMYLHNKGAFHQSSDNNWLRNLHVRSLVNTDECYVQGFMNVTTTSTKCNVCSARFSPLPHYHTSGNMWMSKCGYIKRLLEPNIFEERMNELIESTIHSNETSSLKYWCPQCFIPQVLAELDKVHAPCPPAWIIGKGRYAAEHWVHSHPTVQPCDVLPGTDDNAAQTYRWQYSLLPRNVKWIPELKQAPRFSSLKAYESPDPSMPYILQPITSKWVKLEGRLVEWKFLYDGEIPPEDSWIWDYYKRNNAME